MNIDDMAGTIEQMRQIKQEITDLETAYDLLKQTVIEAMGGEGTATINGQPVVKYSTYETRRFDSKAFSAAHPDIYEEWKTTSTAVRFALIDEKAAQ